MADDIKANTCEDASYLQCSVAVERAKTYNLPEVGHRFQDLTEATEYMKCIKLVRGNGLEKKNCGNYPKWKCKVCNAEMRVARNKNTGFVTVSKADYMCSCPIVPAPVEANISGEQVIYNTEDDIIRDVLLLLPTVSFSSDYPPIGPIVAFRKGSPQGWAGKGSRAHGLYRYFYLKAHDGRWGELVYVISPNKSLNTKQYYIQTNLKEIKFLGRDNSQTNNKKQQQQRKKKRKAEVLDICRVCNNCVSAQNCNTPSDDATDKKHTDANLATAEQQQTTEEQHQPASGEQQAPATQNQEGTDQQQPPAQQAPEEQQQPATGEQQAPATQNQLGSAVQKQPNSHDVEEPYDCDLCDRTQPLMFQAAPDEYCGRSCNPANRQCYHCFIQQVVTRKQEPHVEDWGETFYSPNCSGHTGVCMICNTIPGRIRPISSIPSPFSPVGAPVGWIYNRPYFAKNKFKEAEVPYVKVMYPYISHGIFLKHIQQSWDDTKQNYENEINRARDKIREQEALTRPNHSMISKANSDINAAETKLLEIKPYYDTVRAELVKTQALLDSLHFAQHLKLDGTGEDEMPEAAVAEIEERDRELDHAVEAEIITKEEKNDPSILRRFRFNVSIPSDFGLGKPLLPQHVVYGRPEKFEQFFDLKDLFDFSGYIVEGENDEIKPLGQRINNNSGGRRNRQRRHQAGRREEAIDLDAEVVDVDDDSDVSWNDDR